MRPRHTRAAVFGIVLIGLLQARAHAQPVVQLARVVVNGIELRPDSPPVLVDGEPYGDVYMIAGCLGAGAVADDAAGTVQLAYFGSSWVLKPGIALVSEDPPSVLLRIGGRIHAPLRAIAALLYHQIEVQPGPVVAIEGPRPAVCGVYYEETTERFFTTVELSAPGPFHWRASGTDTVLSVATSEAFMPSDRVPFRRDSRGNPQVQGPPSVVDYDVKGVLGGKVRVANESGPVVRVGISNRYRVPTTRVGTFANPPRIVFQFDKLYQVTDSQQVANGIELRTLRMGCAHGPVVAYCAIADLTAGPYKVDVLSAGQESATRSAVSTIARRAQALVACNGGYFAPDTGHPLGLVICNGEWVRMPIMNRTALFVLKDGRLAIGNVSAAGRVYLPSGASLELYGVNQWLPSGGTDAVVVHTPRWGGSYRAGDSTHVQVRGQVVAQVLDVRLPADVPIPSDGFLISATGSSARNALKALSPGQPITAQMRLEPDVPNVEDALGGGPRLVYQGRPWVTQEIERFRPDVTDSRSPRTAFGVAGDGRVIMAAVDGRQSGYSHGMLLEELAQLMISLGAVEAMAFDSGGSAALSVSGRVVNQPSDGRERPVPNVVAIVPAR